MPHGALLNLVLFNICWFACVYAGASGLVLLAPTAVLLFFIVHAKFSNALLLDIQLALVAIVFGRVRKLGIGDSNNQQLVSGHCPWPTL
jgi:hypothetical protein